MMASNEEMNTGLALYKKPTGTKVSVHYYTTSRNNIDGEWPAIIIAFSDGKEYRPRPLFFAYEDRKQITALLFETYTRLAAAASINNTLISPIKLWRKTAKIAK